MGVNDRFPFEARKRIRFRGGFTIVELLVSITIIAILLAIALPALRSVRMAAQEGISLNNLKQNAARFYAHAAEHRTFPVAPNGAPPNSGKMQINGDNADLYSFIFFPQGGGMGFYYLANSFQWNLYLVSLGDEPATKAWYSPSLDMPEPPAHIVPFDSATMYWWAIGAHYYVARAFMAGPEYFRDPGDRDPSMWRAIRPDETAHPSVKALLFETSSGVKARHPNTPIADAPTPIAFADGHVETRKLVEATAPAPNLPSHVPAQPLLDTYNGFLGQDF